MPEWQMTENPFLVLQIKMMMVFCVKYTIKKTSYLWLFVLFTLKIKKLQIKQIKTLKKKLA